MPSIPALQYSYDAQRKFNADRGAPAALLATWDAAWQDAVATQDYTYAGVVFDTVNTWSPGDPGLVPIVARFPDSATDAGLTGISPYTAAAAGGVVLLLLGWLWYRRRKP